MIVRDKIIRISKDLVKTLGWNDRVLTLACKELDLSPVGFI
jgi:hypothetical protein